MRARRASWLAALVVGPLLFLPLFAFGGVAAKVSTDAVGDPVIAAAGDIAGCGTQKDEETAQLLDAIAPAAVLALGDSVYPDGTAAEFTNCYEPTWGRHRVRTKPVPGNHDYHVRGAAGYFGYFGSAAGDPSKGYYAFDLGSWRLYALNSNCAEVSCGAGSPQEQWLRADLATHPRSCSLAFTHHPRFASGHTGNRRDNKSMADLFKAFYDASGDAWLNGHNHQYERLARLGPSGAIVAGGVRIFVAGTGGADLYPFGSPIVGSEVRSATHGVLKLTLHSRSYDWDFVPIAGATFTDSGSDSCVGHLNSAPLAVDDSLTTSEDTAGTVDVLANDSDPDGDPLTLTASTNGSQGTVSCTPAGSCTYTPFANVSGPDSFQYTVSDGALTDTGTVSVTVSPVTGVTHAVADFDGNGITDISLFRPSNGTWYIRNQPPNVPFGLANEVPAPGDYDGSGTTDIAVFNRSSGQWRIRNQQNLSFGANGDLPVPGDYDGSGTCEIAVYRPPTGKWYVTNQPSVDFGVSTDVPVPGDYDGNGTTDIAVFRPSTGKWYVRNQLSAGFGVSTDVPVPGDYDGNGTTDIAVFRPSTARWYIRNQLSVGFGLNGDVPVPGDYDGNGTSDIAVFRPSTGRWYVRNQLNVGFGLPSDVPLPLPWAIYDRYY